MRRSPLAAILAALTTAPLAAVGFKFVSIGSDDWGRWSSHGPVWPDNATRQLFWDEGLWLSGGEPPRVFKGATINKSQLEQIRSVAAVRLGRVVAVEPGEIVLQQGRLPIAPGCLVVDATAGYDNAPDELFGYNVVDDAFKIFSSDSIKLGPSLNLFNVCLSAALTAYLEATCVDDAFKNSLCYFVSGENLRFSHKTLPALLYYSTKNMDALEKCHPAATMFVLKSRLFDAAPMHHGGLLKFLWAMLGPKLALKAKGKKFLKKVDLIWDNPPVRQRRRLAIAHGATATHSLAACGPQYTSAETKERVLRALAASGLPFAMLLPISVLHVAFVREILDMPSPMRKRRPIKAGPARDWLRLAEAGARPRALCGAGKELP